MPDKYVGMIPTVAGKDWPTASVELHDFIRKLAKALNLEGGAATPTGAGSTTTTDSPSGWARIFLTMGG